MVWANYCGTRIDRYLSEDYRFWINKRVMDCIEEKGATKILIFFNKRTLGIS